MLWELLKKNRDLVILLAVLFLAAEALYLWDRSRDQSTKPVVVTLRGLAPVAAPAPLPAPAAENPVDMLPENPITKAPAAFGLMKKRLESFDDNVGLPFMVEWNETLQAELVLSVEGELRQDPAKKIFLSVEPLLPEVDNLSPVRIEIPLKQFRKSFFATAVVPYAEEPRNFGVFICTDREPGGWCSRKEARDLRDVRRPAKQGRILFFSYLLLIGGEVYAVDYKTAGAAAYRRLKEAAVESLFFNPTLRENNPNLIVPQAKDVVARVKSWNDALGYSSLEINTPTIRIVLPRSL